MVLHCRSVWLLLCHFAADAGGLPLLMAKSKFFLVDSITFWKNSFIQGSKQEVTEVAPFVKMAEKTWGVLIAEGILDAQQTIT